MSESAVEVLIERRQAGAYARIIISNPARANALSTSVMGALTARMETLSRHEEIRAIVLTAAGEKAFISGADIREMVDLDSNNARAFITHVHHCCDAMRRAAVPVIALIGGDCFGAGLELIAACDLRIAADHARFGMPEVRLGLPSVVEAALLPDLIGWGHTREWLLLGEIYTASEAARCGLLQRIVPRVALEAALDRMLEALFASGPNAIRLQKQLMAQWEKTDIDAAVAAGIECFTEAYRQNEPKVMMQAFLDERAQRRSTS